MAGVRRDEAYLFWPWTNGFVWAHALIRMKTGEHTCFEIDPGEKASFTTSWFRRRNDRSSNVILHIFHALIPSL